MKNKLIRFVPFIFPILILVLNLFNYVGKNFSVGTNIENPGVDESDAYVISNYKIDIEAFEDRTVHFKEVIDVDFYKPRASIIRDLPMNSNLEITDIFVHNREFSVEKYGTFISIDMDSTNFTQTLNSRQYILEYTLDYGKAVNSNITIFF